MILNKPEILKGEVKEFIDFDVYELDKVSKGHEPHTDLRRVQAFYSQHFKPEMITEYFEGWKTENYNDGKWLYRHKVTMGFDETISNHLHKKYSDVLYYNSKSRFYPKTLSQFITNCIQAGIKLTWKE